MTRSTLAPAIDAPLRFLDSPRAGRVAYYSDTSTPGRPLVLVHSLNAAPSAFEMKPLFESYRAHRPVYAIDLPGFGLSERGDRRYDPELESAAIEDFMKDVLEEKADVVALSLGAELAARAASRVPERSSSLVLISPTGFGLGSVPGEETSARIRRALVLPGLGDLLFALLTSRPSLRFFLDRSFHGSPPAEMIEYAHATAHQPGAKYAAFCFLSGQIFTRDAWERLHAPLDLPALVLHDRDPNVSFERLPDWLEGHPERVARRIAPTCGLPHWEQPEQTRAALDAFWSESERGDSRARS